MILSDLALTALLAASLCPGGQGGTRFGRAVCAVPDQDGDGVRDFVVTAPYAEGHLPLAGRVYLFSGKGPALLRSIAGPVEGAAVGERVQWIASAGSGGALLLTSDSAASSFLVALDGTLLHTFGSELSSVVGVGDWDQDGREDFAAQRHGHILLLSGEGFAPIAEPVPGHLVGTPGDLNGDGAAEIVIRTTSEPGEALIWLGGHDRLSLELDAARGGSARVPQKDWERWSVVSTGDVNDDGVLDFAIGIPREARVHLFSGANGSLLLTLKSPESQSNMFGYSMVGGEDLNGDGAADLIVGAPDGSLQAAGLFAFGLQARMPLWRIEELERCNGFSYLGAAACALDDRNGDGVREILVSGADVMPAHGVIHRSGNIRILCGASGDELWSFDENDIAGRKR